MEGLPTERQLLFLHSDTRNPPTRHHTRNKLLDSKVRRHLMVEIGKSRRKPPKTPQFDTFVWSLAENSGTISSASHSEHSTTHDVSHLQVPAKDLVVPETAARYNARYATTAPTLHALSVFEKEWGEDQFSAYGFALIMVAGRNAMGSSKNNQFLYGLQFSSLLLKYWTQLTQQTRSISPSPSDNLPSSITIKRSSSHPTSSSHYTADPPESYGR